MPNSIDAIADIAIVGYGPVGQALTIALAQQGHRVTVLERWPAPYPLPRAIAYDHECARILQSLGVSDALASRTTTSPRYEWRNAAGQVLKAFDGQDAPAVSGWPDKTLFNQPDLERVLDARVRSFGTQVQLLQGCDVLSAAEQGDHMQLTARDTQHPDAAPRQIRARFVVGCDGAGSLVREVMGSVYEDLGFSADWLVVDLTPSDPARWSREMLQLCDPARPTTSVSGGPGRRRFEFMLLAGETKAEMNNVDTAWRLLAPHGWHAGNATLQRHAVYTFRGCLATRWRSGRMMLAGDAAHLMPPFAGQGLCAGLRDTAALAWRLDQVLRGSAPATLLDSYGAERSPHVRRFIDFSIMLGGVICILDPHAAAGRDAFLLGPGKQQEDRFPESRLPPSAMLREGDPHAGELAPQGWVKRGEQAGRFDDVVGHGFVLLGLDHDPAAALSAGQRAFLDGVGARVVAIGAGAALQDAEGVYRRWLGGLGGRAVLVRPDFYVFGAGDSPTLVQSLQSCLIQPA